MNNTSNTPSVGEAPIRAGASSSSFSRPAAMIGGATALIAISVIATTLAIKPSAPAGDAGEAARATTVAAQSLNASPAKASGRVADEKAPATAAQKAAAPTKAAPTQSARADGSKAPSPAQRTAAAPVCADCGVVESVVEVKQKGEGSGIGAVGGAVVGGLLGNQVGKGDGKKVATVLGAVGGGVAGNAIEKNVKATIVYQVGVRMQDGTLRQLTQATAPTVGQKVTVEGDQIKVRA